MKPFEFTTKFLGEPQLLFADGGECVDPRLGISTFGPESFGSSRHPSTIRIGFIGTADTIDASKEWLRHVSQGISENEGEQPFPGIRDDRGFFSDLAFSNEWDESLTQTELKQAKGINDSRKIFEASHTLLHEKARLVCERDTTPDILVVALPHEFVKNARVADYWEPGRGQVHRDMRRAFKATAMKLGMPTQIILTRTVSGGKGVDLEERRAWNLLTAIYFKAGGVPWKPLGLTEGTCYIGISFYRTLGNQTNTLRTSIAMAFDESGEGLILRGQEFQWSEDDGASPHLTAEQAENLLSATLDRYRQERKTTPRRVVVHKTSVFWPDERGGFEADRVRIMLWDRHSHQMHELTEGLDQNGAHPAWGLDGKRIYFESEQNGTRQIFMLELSGGPPRQVSSGRFEWRLMGVLPDGRLLLGQQNSC